MKNLWQNKTFWGILMLALVAVTAITATMIVSGSKDNPEIVDLDGPGNTVLENTTAPLPEEATTEKEHPVSSITVTEPAPAETTTAQVPETTVPAPTTPAAEAAGPVTALHFNADSALVWPVNGRVILEYNMDNTIYFPTLDQYKCNPAVVIQADKNMEVQAACSGIVAKIGSNEEIGNYVTLNIGDDYTLTYGQLGEINLKSGQAVKNGDIIGTIGEPTAYYEKEGYNLYLELQQKGKPVDPLDHLDYETE